MRVEQSEHGTNTTNTSEMLMSQLREITGIQDSQILHRALESSQGDIGNAVGLLTAPPPEVQDPGDQQHTEAKGEAWKPQTEGLSDDLQAAIELSLQESHSAQEEEREFNRALEASAEENTARIKRKRCEAQSEVCNPVDWIRQEDWPVGIRNVGNTCWFSAVIQSLFHLPVFRRLVLSYSLSERILNKCKSHVDKRNMAFMQELRFLFALMVGSSRRFVDPSAAVELLRDAFRTTEAQQDVSEFTHKLLDWLEDAFQLAANGNTDDKQQNPMVQLFYGTFVTERKHDGKTLSNIEQFGQYPLQVNGFNNLDECLEGAMIEREIECLHSDQTIPCGRERWFSKLPPVLTFELSRFEFNAQLGRPEKIHKKLEFPQIIYMDRYLHQNIETAHGRRAEVKRLKDQLAVLQQKLECYKNYGSGPTKYPLADMLQFVLEFATTKSTGTSPTEDLRTHATSTSHQPTEPASGDSSQAMDQLEGSMATYQKTPIYKPFTQCRPAVECPPHPAPHSVSDEELHHVRTCLQRWRAEVENNINELKASIERVSQALEGMYSDNNLCQVPYRLHAVLVHEGQANAGHYWAYICDHAANRWMKYNDVAVSEASWEELERDSYGGTTNASAYCLMYIDGRQPRLVAEDTDVETGQVLLGMDSLPPVLSHYVQEDNRWFQQEISEWEEQFSQTETPQGEPVSASATAAPESPGPGPSMCPPQQLPEESTPGPSMEPSKGPSTEDLSPPAAALELQPHPEPETAEEPGPSPGDTPEKCFPSPETATRSPSEGNNEVTSTTDPSPGETSDSAGATHVCIPEEQLHSQALSPAVETKRSQTAAHLPLHQDKEDNVPGTVAAPDGAPQAGPGVEALGPEPEAEPATDPQAEPGGELEAEPGAEPEAEPEADPEANPRAKPGAEPGGELGAEPGADPGTEPRSEPVADPGTEPRTVEGVEEGVEEDEAPTRRRRRPTEDEVSEVEIPNVGRLTVLSNADGYNEEMMLTPAMQGVIMAIAKARQVFDRDGAEAGLIKAFHEEYSRLLELSQEEATPQEDVRLQHALVFFFQNQAPNCVIERTLLEQFADRNLSFDDRAVSIMREARAKLRLIKPEDMDMEEYTCWHDDYRLFRTVFVYLLTGLEQYQHGKVREALSYLVHAYKDNASLLRRGERRGLEQSVIGLYRRKCITALSESALRLFCGGDESEVEEGVAIMNDAVIPCMHLMDRDAGLTQDDRDTLEAIRSYWCSCLTQDMDEYLQVKLGEFLPRVLDCSAEMVVLKDPPKVYIQFPHDLCSRLTAVMESIHNTSVVIVK